MMASAPLWWNVYGVEETKYDWQPPPHFVPQKIYVVQINSDMHIASLRVSRPEKTYLQSSPH